MRRIAGQPRGTCGCVPHEARRPDLLAAAARLALAVIVGATSILAGSSAVEAAPRGQSCSSPAPSSAAVDTCAPFALPDVQLPSTTEYRPPAAPKPLFLPPVVEAPSSSPSPRRLPALKPGMLYAAARGILIGQGFRPAPSGREDGDRCGPEAMICRDFPEAHACSGASTIVCEFVFERPPGEALVVTTTGTNPLELVTRNIQRASPSDLARHKVGR